MRYVPKIVFWVVWLAVYLAVASGAGHLIAPGATQEASVERGTINIGLLVVFGVVGALLAKRLFRSRGPEWRP